MQLIEFFISENANFGCAGCLIALCNRSEESPDNKEHHTS